MQALLSGSGEKLAYNLLKACRDPAQRGDVIAVDGHLALVTLLHSGIGSKTTMHAVAALANLTALSEARVPLVRAGAAAPVVALLRMGPRVASSGPTLANAAIVVERLALTSAGHEALQKAGAIAPLVSLLGAEAQVAKHAAGALCNLLFDGEANMVANVAEVHEAGAIPLLVALLHGDAASAANALRNLAVDGTAAAGIRSAGGIVPLVALLHDPFSAGTMAAAALQNMTCFDDKNSNPPILAALAARPPPPPEHHQNHNYLIAMLLNLRPFAVKRLAAAEANDDAAALQEAIDQAAVVGVADSELQRAERVLRAMREAAEAARRERRASLGLGKLKTPDDFVCRSVRGDVDPVCASTDTPSGRRSRRCWRCRAAA